MTRRPHRIPAPGFTLIEVLIAMVIFAIGFAMVAGVVPAGHLLNRQAEDDVLAAVAGRNAMALIEAKKIYAPAFEHGYMTGTITDGAYNAGEAVPSPDAASDPANIRAAARCGIARALEGSFADFELAALPCPGWAASSPGFRFFADTNNDGAIWSGTPPLPPADATNLEMGRIHAYHRRAGLGALLPLLDLSYPGFSTSLADHPFLCTPVGVDLAADPLARRFTVLVAVLRHRAGDLWPERGTDPTLGGCLTGRAGDTAPRLVASSEGSGLKSVENNGHPNEGAATGAGAWNTYAVGGDDTNPEIPGLYSLPMIVQDYGNNLIEAKYPPCWTPGGYTPFVSAGVDRRLKAGDLFIARESGTVFTVVSARDVASSASLQILEVYPPLRSTPLGSNANPAWRLRAGLFAPPPASGGASPLVRVESLPATRALTNNPNH